MDINAGIIDQRVTGIAEDHPDWLPPGADLDRKKSAAFVLLCMSTCLDMPMEDCVDLLTEGGNDAGVDGLHIGEVEDGEFLVTLFQGKYKKDLSGEAHFPENAVQKAVNTVLVLFDPDKKIEINPRLAPKVEEIRSLVRDGYFPDVRVILCNNGQKWNARAQTWIDQSGLPPDQTHWVHVNHDSIVAILRKTKSVTDSLNFTGKAIVEDFNFKRVLIGKVRVAEIAALFDRHHDALLQRNIRRYLGLHGNRVNRAIDKTLRDEQARGNFYFFNNGITIICSNFQYNGFQSKNYRVTLENMQVINGGQTCKAIQQTLNTPFLSPNFDTTYVLVRIFELAEDDQEFVRDITFATNSQNPVDLRDLRSNDDIQKQLEIGLSDFGYTYKRQREEGGGGSFVVTSSIVAEAVLAIWRKKPHLAKFQRKEHFGKLYAEIFKNLNAAQALLAVLIFRAVENERKRPSSENPPDFLPYASHHLSMMIGWSLLKENNLSLDRISHRNFQDILQTFEADPARFHADAVRDLENTLLIFYAGRTVSLQRLSATFRRGDILEFLENREAHFADLIETLKKMEAQEK